MPELPEVETVVRALRPVLEGRTVRELELLHPRVSRHSDPRHLRDALRGAKVTRLRRRGKFILFELEGRPALTVHLRMSGQLLLSEEPMEGPHVRARFGFRDGPWLNFVDVRTFGTLFLLDGSEPEGFRNLGLEPLSDAFTVPAFATLLQGRVTAVKTLLLRQDLVAGVGNIYASEACYRARTHPATPAGQLNSEQVERLHAALREVLADAVEQMGTTLSDFRDPSGEAGRYGNRLEVYGRENEPCPKCGTTIERMVQHGRSTFFCPGCQQPPRRGGRKRRTR